MGSPRIRLKRHYSRLSGEETAEVVDAVAQLVVHSLKSRSGDDSAKETRSPTKTEEKQPHES